MRFTNSPYEKMMQQKPRPQAPAPAKPPRGSRAPPPGSGPGKAAQGLPVLRVSLLARDWLRVLLPRAYAGPGWREVTAWPVN